MKSFSPTELNFSDKAVSHFHSSLKSRGKGLGVQIGVKKAGCSGYEYFFNFIDELKEEYVVFERTVYFLIFMFYIIYDLIVIFSLLYYISDNWADLLIIFNVL